MLESLSSEQKIEVANNTLNALNLEYYRQVAYLGENPDTFNVSVWENEEDLQIKSVYENIKNLQIRIQKIKDLIESLK